MDSKKKVPICRAAMEMQTWRTDMWTRLRDGVGGMRFKTEGTYVYLWLIHVDVWQKPAQYCKAIILQLKMN